jgi:hypothetical protein
MPRPRQESPHAAPADRPPRIRWPAVLALYTAAFVLHFMYLYLDDVTRQRPGTLGMRLVEELTGASTALLLFPAVAWLERRLPLTLGRWRRTWPLHVVALPPYSFVHTSLIALSRHVIVPLVGMGPYDYGIMRWRYPMEFGSDVIGYATLIGILTFVRVQGSLRDKERRDAELAREVVRARLESLSFRLQPHFVFNALHTISSTIYKDPVAADVMISNLADLLRYSLRTGEQQEVTIAEELEVLRAYLAIIEARFGDRLTCVIDADDEANALAIPALLLQPLVENAVRHGSASERSGSEIRVAIRRAGDVVHVLVENDVAEGAVEPRKTGTGLHASAERLRLLYGDAQKFAARAEGGRFRVEIRYPARPLVAAAAALTPTRYAAARAHR